jgi:hypothetical protein
MLVGPSGIVTLTKLELELNAQEPMLATGRKSIMLGMKTAPPEPLYPVMITAPLLTV